MTRKIDIFDTTLRDGEQSPGASMNTEEKLVVARQLLRMKVDVIEAGFPISSPGDFESVRRIAKGINGSGYCCACFDGNYPTEIPKSPMKNRFETKISENKEKQTQEGK